MTLHLIENVTPENYDSMFHFSNFTGAKLFGSLIIPDFKIFYPAFEISESHFSKKV